ncbi:MAG: RNA polymerase sigma factor [Kiritimatiellae bacterium]|nr:RNA polymerase sigma factor [Kiritimatiellia bacterium]
MSFEELYNQIAPKLTNYLVGSGCSYANACDIVQETFLRVWKKRDTLKDDLSQVSGYIYTVARNIRIDRMRKESFETLQPEIRDEDAGTVEPAVMRGDAEHLRKRIEEAMAQLPPLVREAFSLFQISEMSVREISKLTGASESLVKVRVHRAKQKLRELLSDICRGEGD